MSERRVGCHSQTPAEGKDSTHAAGHVNGLLKVRSCLAQFAARVAQQAAVKQRHCQDEGAKFTRAHQTLFEQLRRVVVLSPVGRYTSKAGEARRHEETISQLPRDPERLVKGAFGVRQFSHERERESQLPQANLYANAIAGRPGDGKSFLETSTCRSNVSYPPERLTRIAEAHREIVGIARFPAEGDGLLKQGRRRRGIEKGGGVAHHA